MQQMVNLKLVKQNCLHHNYIWFVIIKTRANGFWANNLPLFDNDKTHGVIKIIWEETSSEAPSKHMHISNVTYKLDASKKTYE